MFHRLTRIRLQRAIYFCLHRGSFPENNAERQPQFQGQKTRAQHFRRKLYVRQNPVPSLQNGTLFYVNALCFCEIDDLSRNVMFGVSKLARPVVPIHNLIFRHRTQCLLQLGYATLSTPLAPKIMQPLVSGQAFLFARPLSVVSALRLERMRY